MFAALALIGWSLLEEVVLSSSDLVTNFFASKIKHGENLELFNFVTYANSMIASWGAHSPYSSHIYTVGDIDISGLAASTQIYVMILSMLFGFSYGIGVYTAQYFGAKKFQQLRDLVMFKIQISLLISFIFILIVELFSKQLISFIISPKNVSIPTDLNNHAQWISYFDSVASHYSVDQGAKFIKIVAISYLILGIEIAIVTTLRETARPMVSFWTSFLAFFFTIIFLFFLVEPNFLKTFHGFGLMGCAYAVILGKTLQIILVLGFIFIKKYEFIPNRFWKIDRLVVKIAFKKSIWIMINELFWSFSMLMQVKLLSMYSLDSLIANALVSTILSILIVPSYHGIAAGISVLVGNNLGDNKLEIAQINSKRLLWLTVLLGVIISLLLGGTAFIIEYIFTNISGNILILTKKFIWIYALTVTVLLLNGTLYSTIRAGGLVYTAFFMDSIYTWAFTIPIMAILVLVTKLDIILIFGIVRIVEVFKIVPSLYFYFRKKWVRNLVYKL